MTVAQGGAGAAQGFWEEPAPRKPAPMLVLAVVEQVEQAFLNI